MLPDVSGWDLEASSVSHARIESQSDEQNLTRRDDTEGVGGLMVIDGHL